jgi:hypothetical protein
LPAANPTVSPLTYLSLIVYVVSYLLPYESGTSGFEIFSIGLVYCWHPLIGLPWWANVLFAVGFLRILMGKRAFVIAAFAFGLSLTHLLFWMNLPPGPAYYCWVASMGLLLAAAALTPESETRRSVNA